MSLRERIKKPRIAFVWGGQPWDAAVTAVSHVCQHLMRWLLSALLGHVVCPSAMVSKRVWVRNKNNDDWGGRSVNKEFFMKA